MAAIEPARYTTLKEITLQIAVSPTAVGGGRWRATGWSPLAVDVSEPFGAGGWTPLHHAAVAGHTAILEQLLAAGATVDAADKEGPGPTNGRWGRVEWRDDLMQSEWKNNLGGKLFDDFQCAMCTELWQDKTRWYSLWDGDFVNLLKCHGELFGKWQYMRWQSNRT